MEPIKVVVRYADGKVLKGFTQDFFPNKDRFHLLNSDKVSGAAPLLILVKDLKALFFVKDFDGNKTHEERRIFVEGDRPSGRKVEVTFKDGEKLVGSTMGYDPHRPGFFVFPADDKCNNLRVFAVQGAVENVRYLASPAETRGVPQGSFRPAPPQPSRS